MEENSRKGKTRDLFKKIGDTNRTFHARKSVIKHRISKDIVAEDIKKRW